MKSKIVKGLMVCLLLLLTAQSVSAKVYTVNQIDENAGGIYVAGNSDFYPMEYYNEKTRQYEGVMPEILNDVSERCGIDFIYLHDKNLSQAELAEKSSVSLVSAYVTDSNEEYAKDCVRVLSYLYKDKTVNVGWAFTGGSSDEFIEMMKSEAEQITENEINGHFVSSSHMRGGDDRWLIITTTLCCILFMIIILMILLKLKNAKKLIDENKMTDPDTGIGNLVYFENHFNTMVTDTADELHYISYIIIDSNYLQLYHGEATFADAVKYTASVLASYENAAAARITESGFAFAFRSKTDREANRMIEEITAKLNLYIQTGDGEEKTYFHATIYNMNKSDKNCEYLIFNLRRNCSKLIGSDRQYVVCDAHMMNSAIEEKQFLESISRGFDRREFKVYLQFIVDNKTKRIVSAEALSRWDNPEKGILSPASYIKAMESSGLIVEFDYYMFEMTCRLLHRWRATELDALTLSCNITRITLSERDFADRIREISDRYVFDKSKLIIEITEDAIENDAESATYNVRRCKKLGFSTALDDMGSGYTSLINLCEYPIDIVKIDRNILLKTDKKNGRDLFFGIVSLAHSLDLKVVCEGVETEEQNALVSGSECDCVQGWYYSKPLSEREGEEFVKTHFEKINN